MTLPFFRDRLAIALLGIMLVFALTGCPAAPVASTAAAAAPAPEVQPVVAVQPVLAVPPTVVVQPVVEVQASAEFTDGFIYYPNYEVYFDPRARVYWHAEGGQWINGPEPQGISVDVLQSSPNVRMDFRDSPENHHSDVVKQYPHNWQPVSPPVRGRPMAPNRSQQPGPPDRGPDRRDT
jgi:hypothetical protein